MDRTDIAVSSRDPQIVRAALDRWIATKQHGATITSFDKPDGNGMSSETVLFDARWGGEDHALVARIAPADVDVPVFRTYDLDMQFEVMKLVAERSDTPVTECLWNEPDPDAIGAPFFVMRRVVGRVPPDNLPYSFEGWLVDASPAERMALQDDTVWALAGIHGVDLSDVDTSFLGHDPDGPSALRQHMDEWSDYYRWLDPAEPIPVIEDAFAWIETSWPADDGGVPALSWGDARIGNMIYDGFRPAAVLDWEMASIAPRGIDLGWMSYMHVFFQDVAEIMDLPGVPGFMQIEDLVETYEARTGITVTDHKFWMVFAALRYALIMARIHQRQLVFGEVEPSDDPEAGVRHRDWLRSAIDS